MTEEEKEWEDEINADLETRRIKYDGGGKKRDMIKKPFKNMTMFFRSATMVILFSCYVGCCLCIFWL